MISGLTGIAWAERISDEVSVFYAIISPYNNILSNFSFALFFLKNLLSFPLIRVKKSARAKNPTGQFEIIKDNFFGID